MRHRLVTASAVLTLLACGLAACGDDDASTSDASEAEPVTIRMGWSIPVEEIKYVMIADPAQAPNLGSCYEVEWTQMQSTALTVQALAAGTLDAGTVASLSAANGIEQGADVVLTGQLIAEKEPYYSTTWLVRADSGIDSIDDLAGKVVGTSGIGNPTNYVQEFHLETEAGLVVNEDYDVVEFPYPQQEEALASGREDVGPFAQPFYGRAMATGQFRPLFRLTDVKDNFTQLLQAFTREFADEHPDAVRCFVDDWVTVADYVLDPANRDAVIAASSEVTQIPTDVLDSFLLTQDDYFRPEHGAIDVEALQDTWDFFHDRGGLEQRLVAEDHVVDDLLPEGSG